MLLYEVYFGGRMTKEIQFLIKMKQFKLYEGFPNLQTAIFLQDDLDDRFTHNDYIDLLASTLLYHQIVENMLKSLLTQCYYLDIFNLYPIEKQQEKIPKYFRKKLNLLKVKDEFDNKEEFLTKCSELNTLRNNLAHKFIDMNRDELVSNMNIIKKIYHRIRDIYVSNTFRIYNYIQNISDDYSNYVRREQDYLEDIIEIGNIIMRKWDEFYYDDYGIYISIYVYLYNRINPEDSLDINYILEEIHYSHLKKEDVFRYLRIEQIS